MNTNICNTWKISVVKQRDASRTNSFLISSRHQVNWTLTLLWLTNRWRQPNDFVGKCIRDAIETFLKLFVYRNRSAAIGAVDVLLESHFQQQRHPSSLPTKDNVGGSVFVIGRPPGHHAGPNGCVPSSTFWRAPGMTSSGFCLLNTVAVAAVCS